MGEHTEKLFKTEQGRDTHLERKGVGILPGEEECSKDVGQATYIEQFFPVFVCLWPNIQFLFPPLTCSRTIPNMHVQLFSKVDSSPEACGGRGAGGGLASSNVLRRQSLAIYPVSVISLWKCKQEASCKCLTWNPSISCFILIFEASNPLSSLASLVMSPSLTDSSLLCLERPLGPHWVLLNKPGRSLHLGIFNLITSASSL